MTLEKKMTADKWKTVLVYIDAQTGKEADLLILLFTDGGVLTK